MDIVTHRYMLAILSGFGYNVTEVATPWYPRYSGQSKFGKKRLISSARDFMRVWVWFITQLLNLAQTDSSVTPELSIIPESQETTAKAYW
jgi:hypothetical protein